MGSWSEIKLQHLFDMYIRRLKDRMQFPSHIECLQTQYPVVIERACSLNLDFSRIPFLPIFPRNLFASPFAAAEMMDKGMRKRLGMNGGYTFVLPELVTDVVEVPEVPYFIFNIDDGDGTSGLSPNEAEESFIGSERRALTDMEIVALGMHSNTLSHANLYAAASCYDETGGIDLRMEDGGHPVLYHNDKNLDWHRWNIPSCDRGNIIR